MHDSLRAAITILVGLCLVQMLGGCQAGAPAGPDQVICYSGTSEIQIPGGRTVPGAESFARRTLSPSRNLIVEEVIAPGERPGKPAREFVVDMKVRRRTITMTERSGAFSGTGTLVGPAWAWTGWTTESQIPDGTRVVSVDTLKGDVLTAEKRILGPDGKQQFTMTERFKAVSAEEFEKGRALLLAVPANPGPAGH